MHGVRCMLSMVCMVCMVCMVYMVCMVHRHGAWRGAAQGTCLVPSPLPPQQALEQHGRPPEKRRPQRKEAAGDAEADGLVKLILARPTGGGGLCR